MSFDDHGEALQFDALVAALPTLQEHGCSYRVEGGFIRRMREDDGTWLGHVFEHVAIELQNLAGLPSAFGKARSTDQRGVYKVVVRTGQKEVGIRALTDARDLVMAAINDLPFDVAACVQQLKTLLEDNAPYQAKVTFEGASASSGWNAPTTSSWFEQALNDASNAHFGAPVGYIGQGGTIPLMNLLSEGFPTAQMMVCGVLGPKSNAHGPNEFLHVPYAKKLTAAVAQVIAQMP